MSFGNGLFGTLNDNNQYIVNPLTGKLQFESTTQAEQLIENRFNLDRQELQNNVSSASSEDEFYEMYKHFYSVPNSHIIVENGYLYTDCNFDECVTVNDMLQTIENYIYKFDRFYEGDSIVLNEYDFSNEITDNQTKQELENNSQSTR